MQEPARAKARLHASALPRDGDCFAPLRSRAMPLSAQLVWLLVLAAPVACLAWTVTHEELFAEVHDWCARRSRQSRSVTTRKFFYVFTCEYCFSHYVTALFIVLTDYTLLINDWRGYIIGGFALVWVANIYMSLFGLLRTGIKKEKTEVKALENEVESNATGTGKQRKISP